jgi:hypothetical protein
MKKLLLISLTILLFSCDGGSSDSDIYENDNIAPEITILGEKVVFLFIGEPFVDDGAIAIDNIDGDISENIVISGDLVDINNEGNYTIFYDISDSAGNTTRDIRVVNVIGIEIGDFIKGGVVFWIDPQDNTHGLICDIGNGFINLKWGQSGSYMGTTSTSIGSGSDNTDKIINASAYGVEGAVHQSRLTRQGYDDWFLPSKDELAEIFLQRDIISSVSQENGGEEIKSCGNGYYWSSSEYDIVNAWKMSACGASLAGDKDNVTSSTWIRAIRAF